MDIVYYWSQIMSKIATLGVFDSGLGGLTVVAEIKKLYPKSNIVYLGDTARLPYGTRSKKIVEEFAVSDAKFLESRGVEAIVIACNTASALAFDAVRNAVKVPVYEVISQARKTAERVGKQIGVIGTRGTIGSGAYGHTGVACPLLVPFIEEGELDSPALKIVLDKYLQQLGKIDTLILGCTHYPIITKLIGDSLPGVKLINPGTELTKNLPVLNGEGNDKYFVTDMTPRFIEIAEMFLGTKVGDKIELIHL